ncbi:MAG: zinc-binding dehydrogenase [Thaumarchaeota archaeon]|nr:zinc-binding dehydrogenase [Nitrososphaerota archaeon]
MLQGSRIVIKGPNDLEVEKYSIDSDVGSSEFLVKNKYTAISAGTELSIYTGNNPSVYAPNSWCNYPHVPGYAGLGEVIAAGSEVDLMPGDFVFHHAHHSTYDKLYSGYSHYAKISQELLLPEVSLVRFAAIVLSGSVRLSKIELGDKIAIIGLGIVGQIAAQLFTLAGGDVIAFDPVGFRRSIANKIAYSRGAYDPSETKEKVSQFTDERGLDTLVEATGQSRLIMENVGLLRHQGQLILLGTPFSSYEADVTQLLRQIHLKWLTVRGALERDLVSPPGDSSPHPYIRDVAYLLDLFPRGKLKLKELLSHLVAPEEMKKSYEGLLNKKDEYMSVVVDWSERS